MLLDSLYRYAKENNIITTPGYVKRVVSYVIDITNEGKYVQGYALKKELSVMFTHNQNVTPICCKAEILFNSAHDKHDLYIQNTKSLSVLIPKVKAIYAFLQNKDDFETAKKDYCTNYAEVPGGALVLIMVNYENLCNDADLQAVWYTICDNLKCIKENQTIAEYAQKALTESAPCFITGEVTPYVTKWPVLYGEGLNKFSKSIINSFNSPSFTSYGFKQGENSTVGIQAITDVASAVVDIMQKRAFSIPGNDEDITVYWYTKELNDSNDIMQLCYNKEEKEIKLQEGYIAIEEMEITPAEKKKKQKTYIAQALKADRESVKNLFEALYKKEIKVDKPSEINYCTAIWGVTKSRFIPKQYAEISYATLYNNLIAWYTDLQLGNTITYVNMPTLNHRLVPYKVSNNRDAFNSAIDSRSILCENLRNAAIYNNTITNAVYAAALKYMISALYASEEDTNIPSSLQLDTASVRILKVWYNRKHKKEGKKLGTTLDSNSTAVGYNLGRYLAIAAKLQRDAMGKLGNDLVSANFMGLMSHPNVVLPLVTRSVQIYLSKLQNKCKRGYFNRKLSECFKTIVSVPNRLTPDEKAEFAVGYWHQYAALLEETKAKKGTNTTKAEEDTKEIIEDEFEGEVYND